VPLLDLKLQYAQIRDEIQAALEEVIESQYFILGPKVESLENEIAAYCGCSYAVGVSSGTDALIVALMACGIEDGDLVITTPFTFFATVGSIVRLGARPYFIDIDRETYNIDVTLLAEALQDMRPDMRGRVKALLPVHLFGQCAEMERLAEIAGKFRLPVIEDAAQAIGAEYAFAGGEVKRAGSMGDYGCFSFFPSKNLGGFGDGGMVTMNEEMLYSRVMLLRSHGAKTKYQHDLLGGNFRLDALQAAVLLVKLKHLDQWTECRRRNADLYRRYFADLGLNDIILPTETQRKHIYNQFVIKLPRGRDQAKAYLNDNGVGCEIYYPIPLHMQPCFKSLGYQPHDFPAAVDAARNTLALPIFPELTEDQIGYVVELLAKFFKGK